MIESLQVETPLSSAARPPLAKDPHVPARTPRSSYHRSNGPAWDLEELDKHPDADVRGMSHGLAAVRSCRRRTTAIAERPPADREEMACPARMASSMKVAQ